MYSPLLQMTAGADTYSSSSTFGVGSGPILLGDIDCLGTEATLLECSSTPFVGQYCEHERDVGLRCEGMLICISVTSISMYSTM